MGIFKKDFYTKQIESLQKKIEWEEYGSEEYARDMENLSALMADKKANSKSFDWIGVGGILVSIGSLVVAIRGQELTKRTAELAYMSDEDMKLCNGRIWKLKDDYNKNIPKIQIQNNFQKNQNDFQKNQKK